MPQTVRDILKTTQFYSDEQDYSFVKMPPQAIIVGAGIIAEIGEPFCALIVDKDEVSLLIPNEALEDFSQRLKDSFSSQQTYRLITIDTTLEADLVGLMAEISRTLAEANIPIFPFAAYSRDHFLVPSSNFDKAMQALKQLQESQ